MAKTQVELAVDFEKRKEKAVQEVDAVLKKHQVVIKARIAQDGPIIVVLDAKKYAEAEDIEVAKPRKSR